MLIFIGNKVLSPIKCNRIYANNFQEGRIVTEVFSEMITDKNAFLYIANCWGQKRAVLYSRKLNCNSESLVFRYCQFFKEIKGSYLVAFLSYLLCTGVQMEEVKKYIFHNVMLLVYLCTYL